MAVHGPKERECTADADVVTSDEHAPVPTRKPVRDKAIHGPRDKMNPTSRAPGAPTPKG